MAVGAAVPLAAFTAQSAALLDWSAGLSLSDLERPSTLAGWSVGDLLAHLAISASMVPDVIASPAPRGTTALTLAEYVAGYARAAAEIGRRAPAERTVAPEIDPRPTLARRSAEAEQAASNVSGDPVLLGRRGPIRFSDLMRTRAVELVVHGRDLGRAFPAAPPPLVVPALRLVTKALAGALASRHPGRAVELRVPPYAAVQFAAGGSHTRGTPPNVVETAPEVFVDLASGRLAWNAAISSGVVRASGIRADLTDYLPLLA